jgi:sterol 3beta-glucosyltransferase
MQITIIALGTRGDVEPYIALGQGLKQAGYRVRLVTHENYQQLVSAQGLEFHPVQGNIQELMETPKIRELLEKGDFLAISAYSAKESQRLAIQWATEGLVACAGTDLLITGVGGLFIALALAEMLKLPLLQAYIFPFTPTKKFPAILFPQSLGKFGGAFNRLSHHLFRQIMWQSSRVADNLARKKVLNIPAAPVYGPYNSTYLRQHPILCGFSPSVIPKPADWFNTHVCGYWFVDTAVEWTPPPTLVDFIQNGTPPIYVGFGSMSNRNPEATANLVLAALERTKQRAIMLSGWGGLHKDNLPNTVYLIDSIPHAWLFPRVAAVVHHGGAGTTAAGLRAGVPSIVIPFFGDQPFWGQRIADLGVGPQPIPRKQLTVERLARAIQQATTDLPMRQRAAALGASIQAENGMAKAVEVVRSILR